MQSAGAVKDSVQRMLLLAECSVPGCEFMVAAYTHCKSCGKSIESKPCVRHDSSRLYLEPQYCSELCLFVGTI